MYTTVPTPQAHYKAYKTQRWEFYSILSYPTLEIIGIGVLRNAMKSAKEKNEHSLERKEELNVGKGHQRKGI